MPTGCGASSFQRRRFPALGWSFAFGCASRFCRVGRDDASSSPHRVRSRGSSGLSVAAVREAGDRVVVRAGCGGARRAACCRRAQDLHVAGRGELRLAGCRARGGRGRLECVRGGVDRIGRRRAGNARRAAARRTSRTAAARTGRRRRWWRQAAHSARRASSAHWPPRRSPRGSRAARVPAAGSPDRSARRTAPASPSAPRRAGSRRSASPNTDSSDSRAAPCRPWTARSRSAACRHRCRRANAAAPTY